MRVPTQILVLDVETTGFDPARHACIELGAVMLDQKLEVIQEFSSFIAPWDGAEIVREAMKINGIRQQELCSAPTIDLVVERFHEAFGLQSVVPLIAGWNVWFDAMFLRELFKRGNRVWPFSHRLLDVQSIVSFHQSLEASSQEKAIQDVLAEKQVHRALADARQTAKLLRFMANRFLSGPLSNSPRLAGAV